MNNNSRDLELEQQIDAYIKGKLSEEEAHKLWEKLLLRPDYVELLETELGVKSILQSRSSDYSATDAPEVEERATVYRLKQSWKWIAAAASVAILVVAINFLQVNTNQSVGDLAIKNIDISTNISSAPVLRSQKGTITPGDSLLNRGFEAALSGNVEKAVQIYDKIIAEFSADPAAVKAYLNKGIMEYNSGNFKNAIHSFQQVIVQVKERPVTKEKAYWYMGNAYMNIEQLTEAREAIHKTYEMDGIYRQPAFRILRKLDHELGNTDSADVEQQREEAQ